MGCVSSSEAKEERLNETFGKRGRNEKNNAQAFAVDLPLGAVKNAKFEDELRQVSNLPSPSGIDERSPHGSDSKISFSLANVVTSNGIISREASQTLGQIRNASFYGGSAGELMVLEDTTTGTKISLKRQIGKGGFGQIFLGEYEGRQVAVKAVLGEKRVMKIPDVVNEGDEGEDLELAPDEKAQVEQQVRDEQMAQLEAVLMSLMDNPNIVKTFKCLSSFQLTEQQSTGKQNAATGLTMNYQWFIIMEYCQVGSLSSALAACKFHQPTTVVGKQPLLEWDAWAATESLKEVVHALIYLKDNEIIHGDLKAGNVLLSRNNKDRRGFIAKVTDFGLSRILKSESELTTKSFGTVTHMPPELLSKGVLTHACDVFSMGILMWETYAAKSVHKELRDNEVIIKVVNEKLRPVFPADTPACYKDLAEKCWQDDYKKRPTLEELLSALDEVQNELAPEGQNSPCMVVVGTLPRQRHTSNFSSPHVATNSANSGPHSNSAPAGNGGPRSPTGSAPRSPSGGSKPSSKIRSPLGSPGKSPSDGGGVHTPSGTGKSRFGAHSGVESPK